MNEVSLMVIAAAVVSIFFIMKDMNITLKEIAISKCQYERMNP